MYDVVNVEIKKKRNWIGINGCGECVNFTKFRTCHFNFVFGSLS